MRTAARNITRPASRNSTPPVPAKSVKSSAAALKRAPRAAAAAAPARSRSDQPSRLRPATSNIPMVTRPAKPGSVLPQPIATPAPVRKITFRIGDKAVHPQHGVGEVTAIERKEIGGNVLELYVLRILDNGMKVMVSKEAAHQVGLREVMSKAE